MLMSLVDANRIPQGARVSNREADVQGATADLRARCNRQRADRALSEDYASMKGEVIRAVRGWLQRSGLHFDQLDLEAFYNAAWASLCEKMSDGASIEQPGGYLVTVAYRRGIDEARVTRPGKRAVPDVIENIGVDVDLPATLDRRTLISSFQEAMGEVLTGEQRALFGLCLFDGFTRPQAAMLLGESHERVERVMDDARARLRPLLCSIKNDEWCARYSSRLRALARGMLAEQGERYRTTLAHLDRCPACRAELRGLQGAVV
jgi:DNA-directed RNA polymerase specialized sigma24 family protein